MARSSEAGDAGRGEVRATPASQDTANKSAEIERAIAERAAAKTRPLEYEPVRRHPMKELLALGVFVAALVAVSLHFHYALPPAMQVTTPAVPQPQAPLDAEFYRRLHAHELDSGAMPMYVPGLEESDAREDAIVTALHTYFSEGNALHTVEHLSEAIGYRVVGTKQHVEAERWLQGLLERYVGWHDTGAHAAPAPYGTQVELFPQRGHGSHLFNILGHDVWKQYYGMSNLIVRISDGSEESKRDALLLNAHLDSTLPSPGAADDGVGVAIMLEVLRILTLPGAPRLRHSVVLLFNNGEESLQDASHMYMTQENTTSPSVRAVVNLEACGTRGPTLLFQATDAALISAYGRVPHPFGTVLASDVFSSGVIMSDTDFRQFVQYGNGLPGLDMAVVGTSYLYHTRKDVPAYLEAGMLQHFGENVLSLVESLAVDAESVLPEIKRHPFRRVLPVYFSVFGRWFVQLDPRVFKFLILALAVVANFALQSVAQADEQVPVAKLSIISAFGVVLTLGSALLATNLVALLMRLIGSPGSWFTHEWLALALYVPPALAAMFGTHLLMNWFVERTRRPILEYTTFSGAYVLFALLAMVMNSYALGSAYLPVLATLSLLPPLVANDTLLVGLGAISSGRVAPDRRVRLPVYFAAAVPAATLGAEGFISFMDMIVPLLGRMGRDAPADHVIGSLVAALTVLNTLWVMPLAHRYGPRWTRRVHLFFLTATVVMVAVFARRAPFDATHPRRLLLHHVENITSGEFHVAHTTLDAVPGLDKIGAEIQRTLLGDQPNATLSWAHAAADAHDLDVLFPLTEFVEAQRLVLPRTPPKDAAARDKTRYADFRVRCADSTVHEANATREVHIRLEHPGLAWSVVSFNAAVVDWDFPEPPPEGMQQHHLKDVSRVGENIWEMRVVYRLSPAQVDAWRATRHAEPLPDTLLHSPPVHAQTESPHAGWKLKVHYSGLDASGMYPHHKGVSMHKDSMQDLARIDATLAAKHPEVDAMLMSVVAGVAEC